MKPNQDVKTCLVFAGQSIQREGMGADLWTIPAAQEILKTLRPILGLDLEQITTRMPDAELQLTFNAQRAIHAHHVAHWAAYRALNPTASIDAVIGNSMGIVAALVAAGSLSVEDSGRLIMARAEWFRDVCRELNGEFTLVAVQTDDLNDLIPELVNFPGIELALRNSRRKGTLGGRIRDLQALADHARGEDWPVNFKFLNVEGPFHTAAFARHPEVWRTAVDSITIETPRCAVFMGTSGRMEFDPVRIRKLLFEQPFRNEKHFDAVRSALRWGARSFLEVSFAPQPVHWIPEIVEDAGLPNVGISAVTTVDLCRALAARQPA